MRNFFKTFYRRIADCSKEAQLHRTTFLCTSFFWKIGQKKARRTNGGLEGTVILPDYQAGQADGLTPPCRFGGNNNGNCFGRVLEPSMVLRWIIFPFF